MTVVAFLLPVALFLGMLGLVGFLWSLRRQQFDDLDGAAYRALLDQKIPTTGNAPDERHDGFTKNE